LKSFLGFESDTHVAASGAGTIIMNQLGGKTLKSQARTSEINHSITIFGSLMIDSNVYQT
jgi:hypothetical protein